MHICIDLTMHMCLYVPVCVLHTSRYELDTAPVKQDTCRYKQIHADTSLNVSHMHRAYAIWIGLYHVHMRVHMSAI